MTPPGTKQRVSRLYIAALAFYCIGFLIVFGFTSAVDWQWLSRGDLEPAYAWPAGLVSAPLQDHAATLLCGLSLGQDCAPVATPGTMPGLRCWGAAGMSWCIDPPFTTATALWLLVFVAVYAATCIALPNQTLAPRPLDPRARRNDAVIQLTLNVAFAAWMIWDATAALEVTMPAEAAACTPANTACIFDLSDTLPGGVGAALAALLFAVAILQLLYRHRRDFIYRADPIPETRS